MIVMLGKGKILIVDGNEDLIGSLSTYFELNGYGTLKANNTAEAVRLHKKHHPSYVVTNIDVGSESGIQMAIEIRRYDRENERQTFIAMMHGNYVREDTKPEDLLADALFNVRNDPDQLMHKLRREAA